MDGNRVAFRLPGVVLPSGRSPCVMLRCEIHVWSVLTSFVVIYLTVAQTTSPRGLSLRIIILFLILPYLAGAQPGGQTPPPAAAKVLDLFNKLNSAANTQRSGQKPPKISFSLTESELNQYLAFSQKVTPRPGLESMQVKFFPQNYISTYTVINFDAVEKWKPGTIPTLLKPVLSGKKAIWVDIRANTQNRTGAFSIEKAYFQNVRIPAMVIEKVIQVIASRQPEHYDTSKPVVLPFGLERIWTNTQQVGGNN